LAWLAANRTGASVELVRDRSVTKVGFSAGRRGMARYGFSCGGSPIAPCLIAISTRIAVA
jgi:hypothetical protein